MISNLKRSFILKKNKGLKGQLQGAFFRLKGSETFLFNEFGMKFKFSS